LHTYPSDGVMYKYMTPALKHNMTHFFTKKIHIVSMTYT